ncbi:3-hydroxyisobutyrate dehydrogenase [Pelagibius sp. Alg239-R121]|uniref:3-hydroxyisobutyrate dehydrogenase n=1 Tax=Pelagibius sp. Alg239-R121 TaxID=2993448 RepID=UPI0024A76ADC|nr:3-hydroxyisobutyrate dehydrogenase [Pelagibius sp. Alg239-R121]
MAETIGFIGLGNMGLPMVEQLLKAEYAVRAFDLSEPALKQADAAGATIADSIADAARGATTVVTMLPAGQHVRTVYLSDDGLISSAAPGTLLIDSSTIDVETSRAVGTAASNSRLEMIDAPVTGGVMAARVGKLNFIVGGTEEAFERARPVLDVMGQKLLYAGPQGSGIGVKICNNMSLGISMIAAAETLMMAKRLGLDLERTFEIITNASGQNWALSNYCPLPGFLEGVPSTNGYKPGFTAEMMRKDLRLSQDAARSVDACTPLAAHALSIFSHFCDSGDSQTDYSGISKLIGGDAWDYPFDPGGE